MKLALARKSPQPAASFDMVAYRASIKATPFDAKIDELRSLRRSVEAQIFEAQTASQAGEAQISPDARAIHTRVQALLGEPPSALARDFEGHLRSLRLDRDAIDAALKTLGERQSAERVEKFADELRARKNEWDDLNLNIALKLVEVRDLERRREEFKTSLVGAAGLASLRCNLSLARALLLSGEIKSFLEEAIRAGIISQSEANL